MREWLLLGVVAVGGILFVWLLFFKSLAALYEWWISGQEFEKLKREAASRRSARPSDLMRKKSPVLLDDASDGPVIPQGLLDSLSDDDTDPRLVPQKVEPKPAGEPVEGAPASETPAFEVPPVETVVESEVPSQSEPETAREAAEEPTPSPAPEPDPTPQPKPNADDSTTTTSAVPASFPLPPLGGNPPPPPTTSSDDVSNPNDDNAGQSPRPDGSP